MTLPYLSRPSPSTAKPSHRPSPRNIDLLAIPKREPAAEGRDVTT